MSIANQADNNNKKTVAVIGDGAMTAGIAFEALSHSGHLKPNLLIILNDNDMSISENVGGLSNYFSRIWASKTYKGIKKSGASFLKPLPQAYHLARKVETQMKAMVAPGTIFEELGLNYIGPIDGHNLKELKDVISNLKEFDGPQFLHVITKKGAGLDPAEADRIGFHAIGKINAINKLAKMKVKVGFPDKWEDYSKLELIKDENNSNYFEARINIAEYNFFDNLSDFGKPVDKSQWLLTPQTVNAGYVPIFNEIIFPAAFLQPPFFDMYADPAVNYGAIGSVIGHEILHGFDDSGADFDEVGNLRNWWTEKDLERFNKLGEKLANQFSEIEVLPGNFINGKFTE